MTGIKHELVGKVFKRGGGRYPGHWVVIAVNPGGGCICLGIDYNGDVIGAANYQQYYVARKEATGWINVEDIRFERASEKEVHVDGAEDESGGVESQREVLPVLWSKDVVSEQRKEGEEKG